MSEKSIETFDALCDFLREFNSFYDDPPYDSGGVILLLSAVLDNLREHEEEVLGIVNGYLSEEQQEFLVKLTEAALRADD